MNVYREGLRNNTSTLDFDPEKILEYRKDGNIVFATEEARNKIKNKAMEISENQTSAEVIETPQIVDRVPFDLFFNKDDNKIIFTFTEDVTEPVSVSIKDIDSRACIYHLNMGPSQKGFDWWSMPLPKVVIDFQNNPRFGGFYIEVHSANNEFLGTRELRLKEIEIRKPLMDISDTEPIFMNYEEFFVDRIYDVLPLENQDLVLDIGANVGLWTKYILSKGAGKVYCFEPNLKAIDHLKSTLKEDTNTHVIEKAVYKEKATLQFHIDDANSLVSSLIPEPGKSPSYNVDAITLEDAINLTGHQNIDLVKIDIEGAEFEIIENLSREISDRINSFLIEFHDFYFDNGMHKVDSLEQKLKDLGFTTYRLPGYKVIYASKMRKNYWLNRKGIIESRNLFNTSKVFSWDDYNSGKSDGYNHTFNEIHFSFDAYTNGCNYERYGCVIEKGDVVVDIGANVGIFANAAYHKGASKIYCFEPSNLAFECLERNKSFNTQTFKAAIGKNIGLTSICLPSTDDTMGASIYQKKGVINYSPILSMDYLFSTGVFDKIDFLKIDCEGAEKEIFEGLSDDNLKRIKKISLEFHKNLLSEEFSDELIRRMTRNDFKVFQLFIGNGDLRIYNFWKS
jgi:FkbM family methyltransferase